MLAVSDKPPPQLPTTRRASVFRAATPRSVPLLDSASQKISHKIRAEVEFVSLLSRKQAHVGVGAARCPVSPALECGLCGAVLELVSEASNGAL